LPESLLLQPPASLISEKKEEGVACWLPVPSCYTPASPEQCCGISAWLDNQSRRRSRLSEGFGRYLLQS